MDDTCKISKTHKCLYKMFMKEDPLHFLIKPLYFGMKKHIFAINVVKSLIILYLQIFNAICVVYICSDVTYLRQYISGILIQQVGISSYALMIYYARDILHLSDAVGTSFLPFNATGTKIHQELLRQCALTRKFFPLTFILLTAVHCGLLPVVSDFAHYQFAVTFLKEHLGAWSYFFLGLYYLCVLSAGYSIGCICCVSLYLGLHLKFQFQLLVSYLKQISLDTDANIEDGFYQDLICKRLTSFIAAHVKIKRLSFMFLEIGKWSVLVTTVSCSFLYTSLVHFIAMGVGSGINFISALGLIVAAVFTYIVARGGQDLQDESSNLYSAACECDWADWNVQNRRILLMIIINTSKTVKMTSFGLLDLGNVIMLRMLKLTYSLVLLFINVNK